MSVNADRVTVRLFGGLGNQLFQYAVGRAVADQNKCGLLLDARETNAKGGHWPFALSHFNITAGLGDASNLPPSRSRKISYMLWRWFGQNPKFIREAGLGYNADIATLGAGSYLHGYFQSEKYFERIIPTLRKELTFSTQPSAQNADWIENIQASNSVSLHVRRGDYMTAGGAYAVCDQDYYRRAVAHIVDKTQAEPEIFVFSDDPEWAKAHLDLGYKAKFSDHNDASKHYEDMRLISQCKHNITANSTFSWWGSWLNANLDKIVVAPKDWCRGEGVGNLDILPQTWVSL